MIRTGFHVVTGAFGFSGRAIAGRLLAAGKEVRTLTNHPGRDPFGGKVPPSPLRFDDPAGLARSLAGADVLYDTYWIRFPRRGMTYERAVENTGVLLRAAREAGVRRVVHIGIANASEGVAAGLPYYRGKAAMEGLVAAEFPSSHAIIRPTVIFGRGDILINNIAWFLRRFPLFLIPGSGGYGIQPAHVEDLGELAVRAGLGDGTASLDAAGPETFTFRELVERIRRAVGSRSRIIPAGPRTVFFLLKGLGLLLGDVVLTADEIAGLRRGLLASREPSRCPAAFTGWLEEHRGEVGLRYASEIARHYDR